MNDSFIDRLKRHWNPRPVELPRIDPEFPSLNGLQRAAESFRYTILSFERWISGDGTLREWLRFNSTIGSILAIPATFVVPLVTFILWQIVKWTGWLVGIAGNLILLPLATLAAVIITIAVIALLKLIFSK